MVLTSLNPPQGGGIFFEHMRTHVFLRYKATTTQETGDDPLTNGLLPTKTTAANKNTRRQQKSKKGTTTSRCLVLLTTASRCTSNGAVLSNPILKLLYYSWSV